MAVSQSPVDHLERLPDELILEITEQPCLSVRDLIALARTSRRHYRIAISPAYKAHVEHQYGFAIYWAIENEQHGTLGRLLEHGVDVNMGENYGVLLELREIFDTMDNSCMKASQVIEMLDPEAKVSPLAWAASLGRASMVDYLLDHDADIELHSGGLCNCSDEFLCCPHDLPKIPEFQMTHPTSWGFVWWTPLHYAICNRNPSTAQLLLQRGANALNVIDDNSSHHEVTALHIATRWGLHDTINYLLDKDLVDLRAHTIYGVTVLHLAYLACDYDLVNKFLDRGADINQAYVDQTGPWTIFSMACAERSFDRALEYLRRGADPHFVLGNGYEDGDDYTVMRLIYSGFDLDTDDLDQMMELEREIIAGGGPSPSDSDKSEGCIYDLNEFFGSYLALCESQN